MLIEASTKCDIISIDREKFFKSIQNSFTIKAGRGNKSNSNRKERSQTISIYR
jgi:hypothetical protein